MNWLWPHLGILTTICLVLVIALFAGAASPALPRVPLTVGSAMAGLAILFLDIERRSSSDLFREWIARAAFVLGVVALVCVAAAVRYAIVHRRAYASGGRA